MKKVLARYAADPDGGLYLSKSVAARWESDPVDFTDEQRAELVAMLRSGEDQRPKSIWEQRRNKVRRWLALYSPEQCAELADVLEAGGDHGS